MSNLQGKTKHELIDEIERLQAMLRERPSASRPRSPNTKTQSSRPVVMDDVLHVNSSRVGLQQMMDTVPDNLSQLSTIYLKLNFHVEGKPSGSMILDVDLSKDQVEGELKIPIYDLRISTIADNIMPDWYANGLVATAYKTVLDAAGLTPNYDQDKGRVILHSTNLRNNRISTSTLPLKDLPDGILNTIEAVMQSTEEFQINKALEAEVQIMLEPRGNGWRRNKLRLDIEEYFNRQTLINPDWLESDTFPGACMAFAALLAPVREICTTTGDVSLLSYLHVPGKQGFTDMLCSTELLNEGPRYEELIKEVYANRKRNMEQMLGVLCEYMKELNHPNWESPDKWVQADLKYIAQILGVTIHVIYYEHGCSEFIRFGQEHSPWKHMYLVYYQNHYFACGRVHLLMNKSSKSGQAHGNVRPTGFCDFCRAGFIKKPTHRLECMRKNRPKVGLVEHYREKCMKQYRNPFIEPFAQSNHSGKCGRYTRLAYCDYCQTNYGLVKVEGNEYDPGMVDEDFIGILKNPEWQDDWEFCRRDHSARIYGYKQCATCMEYIPFPSKTKDWKKRYQYMNDHLCFCQRKDLMIGDANQYWVWDTESLQRPIANETGVTELPPYLICACNMLNPDDKLEFEGYECVNAFMREILQNPRFDNTTWLAHNSAAYDVQFLCRWAHRHGVKYDFINSPGSSHAKQQVNMLGRRFIDSSKFIPIPLAEFAKTFGLSASKGDFPLKFALEQHLEYEGCIPPLDENDWYNLRLKGRGSTKPEAMSKKVEFVAWYVEEEKLWWTPNHPERPKWNFMEQFKKYCWLDVEVLRQGCLLYRKNFLEFDTAFMEDHEWKPYPIDPFQYMTQAQFLLAWFLYGMPEQQRIASIPRIPKIHAKQSDKALQWLLREQDKLRERLQDSRVVIRTVYNHPSAREYLLALENGEFLPVDGYVKHRGVEYIFQYHGCYWHGCPQCNEHRWGELHKQKGVPFSILYERTVEHSNLIKASYPDAVYTEVWECMADTEVLLLEVAGEAIPTINTDVITDRDVFFGGRVEVFQPMAIADFERGEDIRYIDVVSHYPHICAFKRLCTGHPKRLLGPEIDLRRVHPRHPDRYFGFFRAYVIPDINDIYGGLPSKGEERQLVFSNEPGIYTGFLEELYERMEHGLQVQEVYEILYFDTMNSTLGPFRGYIAYNFRDKMEASGWEDLIKDTPFEHEDISNVQVQNAVCDYLYEVNKELCRPRPEKVSKNKGRRFMAKLCINCIWGKFVQKDVDKDQFVFHEPENYYDLMHNDLVDEQSIQFERLSVNMFNAKYSYKEEFVQRGAKINPYLGASVTGWARTILHKKLREVRGIYCDTDSVIYRHSPAKPATDIGVGIGQWQNEITGGLRIQRFYALGPKCYCLVFDKPDKTGATYKIKAKGITMTLDNHEAVSPDDFLRVLLKNFDANYPLNNPAQADNTDHFITLKHFHIALDHHNRTGQEYAGDRPMIAIHTEKKLQATFSKREPVKFYGNDYVDHEQLQANIAMWFNAFETVPYGFCSVDTRTPERVSRICYGKWYAAVEELNDWNAFLQHLDAVDVNELNMDLQPYEILTDSDVGLELL